MRHWTLSKTFWLLLPLALGALKSLAQEAATAPSDELLEFLADFGETDDDTFDLVLFYGLRDSGDPSSNEDAEEKDDED